MHYIPSKYVVDSKTNKPYKGFFLLIHSGVGSSKKRYLLNSEQIASTLKITKDECFCVGALAYSKKFEANDDGIALDLIENVLQSRSEEDSRRFLHSVQIPEYPLKRANIQKKWLIPIPNEHLFIPDAIYKIKSGLKMVLDCMAASFEDIGDVLMERDAEQCLELFQKIKDDPSVIEDAHGYWIDQIGPFNFGGKLLTNAIEIHNDRYDLLVENEEKIQRYGELQEKLQKMCWAKFEELSPKTKSVPGGLKFVPYRCKLSFDVDPKNYSTNNVILSIDADDGIPKKKDRVVISREIFTSYEGSKLGRVDIRHAGLCALNAGIYFSQSSDATSATNEPNREASLS